MKTKRFRLIVPHAENCRAEEYVKNGQWQTPWTMAGGLFYRDAIGRINGMTTMWTSVRCCCFDCNGRAIVRESVLDEAIRKAEEDASK